MGIVLTAVHVSTNIGKVLLLSHSQAYIWLFAQKLNLVSSTWRVEIDELGILEGETYEDTYQDVVKFLGVPYAENPKKWV